MFALQLERENQSLLDAKHALAAELDEQLILVTMSNESRREAERNAAQVHRESASLQEQLSKFREAQTRQEELTLRLNEYQQQLEDEVGRRNLQSLELQAWGDEAAAAKESLLEEVRDLQSKLRTNDEEISELRQVGSLGAFLRVSKGPDLIDRAMQIARDKEHEAQVMRMQAKQADDTINRLRDGLLHERERLDSERRSLQVRMEAQDAQCRQLQQRLDEQQRLLGRSEEQKTRLERLAERTAEENERLRAESERMQAENRKARQVRGTGVHLLVMELRIVHGSLWA